MKKTVNEQSLPISQLEKYGLAEKGKLLMDAADIQAILEGRRTKMLKIYNVKENGETIKQLDVKISVAPDVNGKPQLVFHPNYKEAPYPKFLTDVEAQNLQNGETVNITKKIKDEKGEFKDVIVEFDTETNEFVITDSKKVQAPDMMNYEYLSDEQKESFKKGKPVELSDGTKFRFSGTNNLGITANKVALIASILIDGGISYLLYSGIRALARNESQGTLEQAYSAGYKKALEEYQLQEKSKQKESQTQSVNTGQEYTRERKSGIGR